MMEENIDVWVCQILGRHPEVGFHWQRRICQAPRLSAACKVPSIVKFDIFKGPNVALSLPPSLLCRTVLLIVLFLLHVLLVTLGSLCYSSFLSCEYK